MPYTILYISYTEKTKQASLSLFLLASVIAIMFLPCVQAGTSHGVNGYVDDCGTDFPVTGAYVVFQLFDSAGNPRPSATLPATVGDDGWYVVDIGNFDVQWNKGDIVLINISKDGNLVSTNVTLTEAGNDQAFTVCLGPELNYICACGNNICEYWKPHCEAAWSITLNNIRCPEDCADCVCGNDVCQPECGENSTTCPDDCIPISCGDGLINSLTEQCDWPDFGNITNCTDFGFTDGTLSCTGCLLNTSNCTSGYCGDGIVNPGEQCDGSDWGNFSNITNCTDFGFTDGNLSCTSCVFDTSQCVGPLGYCSDSIINPGEQCDGNNWNGMTGCGDFGFTDGTLSCVSCLFDTSQCTTGYCGDGIVNPGEQCDGNNFGNIAGCEDFGFAEGGDLACNECKFDTNGCEGFTLSSQCGDGKCAGAETQSNCCLDCGCPENKCHSMKCIKNKCQETCCLFGYCCSWLGLCWYWHAAIAIAIVIAIIIYIVTRWNLNRIIRKLDSITKLKVIALAEKAELYEK